MADLLRLILPTLLTLLLFVALASAGGNGAKGSNNDDFDAKEKSEKKHFSSETLRQAPNTVEEKKAAKTMRKAAKKLFSYNAHSPKRRHKGLQLLHPDHRFRHSPVQYYQSMYVYRPQPSVNSAAPSSFSTIAIGDGHKRRPHHEKRSKSPQSRDEAQNERRRVKLRDVWGAHVKHVKRLHRKQHSSAFSHSSSSSSNGEILPSNKPNSNWRKQHRTSKDASEKRRRTEVSPEKSRSVDAENENSTSSTVEKHENGAAENAKEIVDESRKNEKNPSPNEEEKESESDGQTEKEFCEACNCHLASDAIIVVGHLTLRLCESNEKTEKQGGSAAVIRAWAEAPTSRCVVVKRVREHPTDEKSATDLKLLRNELNVLEEVERRRTADGLSYDRVIRMLDHGAGTGTDGVRYLMLVEELGVETLREFLEKDLSDVLEHLSLFEAMELMTAKRKPDDVLRLFTEVVEAIAEFHKVAVHLDLNPGNLMFVAEKKHDGRQKLKLIDFGGSKLLSEAKRRADDNGDNCPVIILDHTFGTKGWMAPEQIDPRWSAEVGKYLLTVSAKSDMWALGSILQWLLNEAEPFQSISEVSNLGMLSVYETQKLDVVSWKMFAKFDMESEDFARIFPKFVTIIDACMQLNPESRPTTKGLLEYLDGRCRLHGPRLFDEHSRFKRVESIAEDFFGENLRLLNEVIEPMLQRYALEDAKKDAVCEYKIEADAKK